MNIMSYLLEHNRYLNVLGIAVIFFIAFLFSKNRRAINFKLLVYGLLFEFGIAYMILKTQQGQWIISGIARFVSKLYQFADKGSEFVFGKLSDPAGAWSFIFAVKVLPIIIFFGALMALLFYTGVVQWIVSLISRVVQPIMKTSGAETLCAIANSFLGQTESPLLIRSYLKTMTRSEIMLVMISGMGTISGAILAVFAAMGVPAVHLLTASAMAIPGTIMISKILYPETEKPETADGANAFVKSPAGNMLDAISMGTTDGLYLALNVGAMLIAFISLIALADYGIEFICHSINWLLEHLKIDASIQIFNLKILFGYLFSPFGYLLGFTGTEAEKVGELLGYKVTINELIAYSKMLDMNLSPRTVSIVTYALCGFSNFSCIGIQIGGIGSLVPEKRKWLSELGLMAVLGSSLSNLLSAMIVGLLI